MSKHLYIEKYTPAVRLQGGINSALPLTLSGNAATLTVNNTVNLLSSFAGGDNDSDSTSRINLYSYQRAQLHNTAGDYAEYGEVIRIYSRKEASKQMIAWYGPTSYNPTTHDPIGDDTTWFWMGAHYEANDYASVHGHWSLETPDASSQMQTRFEFRIWDPTTGNFGMDRTIAKFNAADVIVEQSNGAFWLAAAAGTYKNMYFTNDTTVVNGGNGKRWGLQSDITTESGSNIGTNFRINAYNDSGSFLSTPLFIQRSNGRVGVNTTTPAYQLDVNGTLHSTNATLDAATVPTQAATDSSTKAASTAFVANALPGLAANAPLATSGQGYLFGPAISPWATTSAAALVGNGTTNVMKVTQFVCPLTITITKVSVNVTTNVADTTGNVAIYDAAGTTKILDVNFSTASTGPISVTISAVTLQAGKTYYLATSSANTAVAISGIGMSANFQALFDAGSIVRVGYSSTTLSGTTMPSSIGTLTAANFSIGCPLFEP